MRMTMYMVLYNLHTFRIYLKSKLRLTIRVMPRALCVSTSSRANLLARACVFAPHVCGISHENIKTMVYKENINRFLFYLSLPFLIYNSHSKRER